MVGLGRRRSLLTVAGLALASALPVAVSAQIAPPAGIAGPPSTAGDGCAGSGPGIVTGRTPNFTSQSIGVARIVPSGTDGDAFVSAFEQSQAARMRLANGTADPRSATAYAKNPLDPAAAAQSLHVDLNDPYAVVAAEQKQLAMIRSAISAGQSMRQVPVNKDGSFTCRGLDPGKYHVLLSVNSVSQGATGGVNPTGLSQSSLEADFSIPRVKPGQRVLVEISRYATVSSIRR